MVGVHIGINDIRKITGEFEVPLSEMLSVLTQCKQTSRTEQSQSENGAECRGGIYICQIL